jgi:hypothetical protein
VPEFLKEEARGFAVALALTPMKDWCKKFFPMESKGKNHDVSGTGFQPVG